MAKARTTITRSLLRDLPPLPAGATKARIFDDRLTGFIAERRRSGVTFYFRYTDPRRRSREQKLGRLGDVTVDQARRAAELLRSAVSLGADPAAERARLRAVPTVAEFARDRYLPHVAERLSPATHDNYGAYLRRRLLPALGAKALDEVSQGDVLALRRRLQAEGLSNPTVNRHLAVLRSMFNLALKWELYAGRNPAASPGMLPERHRDRFLTAAETRTLLGALDAEPNADAAAALALLVFTGARKREVLNARWEHVHLAQGIVTVPLSKNGRPRQLPLSPAAARVLEAQACRRAEGNPFVFPSRRVGGQALGNVEKVWAKAKRAAGLAADLRIHDLRHSLASALANAGTPLYEIGAVLGHRQLSTTTRYAHHSPQRLVDTATVAAKTWELLPSLSGEG